MSVCGAPVGRQSGAAALCASPRLTPPARGQGAPGGTHPTPPPPLRRAPSHTSPHPHPTTPRCAASPGVLHPSPPCCAPHPARSTPHPRAALTHTQAPSMVGGALAKAAAPPRCGTRHGRPRQTGWPASAPLSPTLRAVAATPKSKAGVAAWLALQAVDSRSTAAHCGHHLKSAAKTSSCRLFICCSREHGECWQARAWHACMAAHL